MNKGFTKFDNEIFEMLLRADLNCTQLKIMLAIVRYTYGYHREECLLTASYIAMLTGKSQRTVEYGLKALCEKNYIIKKRIPNKQTLMYAVNKLELCKELQNNTEACCIPSPQCISDVPTQYSSDNKDNSTYTNNKYNYKEQRKNTFPTPKATKFSDFTGHSNIDYKKLEKDALRRKIELSKKEHIESG